MQLASPRRSPIVVVDGPGFFVALAGERVLGQAQVHVAEAA